MPEKSVASSKRIELPGCACAADMNETSSKKNDRHHILVPSGGYASLGSGHIRRHNGSQQYGWNGLFRSCFRSGMAADTNSLLAAAKPKPARFFLQCPSLRIEQLYFERLIRRCTKIERAVLFNLRLPEQSLATGAGSRIKPHSGNGAFAELKLRGVGIQAEQVGIGPVMQC